MVYQPLLLSVISTHFSRPKLVCKYFVWRSWMNLKLVDIQKQNFFNKLFQIDLTLVTHLLQQVKSKLKY